MPSDLQHTPLVQFETAELELNFAFDILNANSASGVVNADLTSPAGKPVQDVRPPLVGVP